MAKNGLKGISFSCIIGKDWLNLHQVFGRMDSFKNDILGVTLNFRPLTCSFPSDFLMGGGNLKISISNIYISHQGFGVSFSGFAFTPKARPVVVLQCSINSYYYAKNN